MLDSTLIKTKIHFIFLTYYIMFIYWNFTKIITLKLYLLKKSLATLTNQDKY